MKKIFMILICAMMICAMTVVAFAEGDSSASVGTDAVETEILTTEEEIVTEGEISGTEAIPADTPTVTTEAIVKWVETHIEEISVIITLIATLFYQVRKHTSLNKSIATLNNNSVSVVENSNGAIQTALLRVADISSTVEGYKNDIAALLAEIRQSDEEKKRLVAAFNEVKGYLKTAELANVELANEVAELLVLANIPNAKKEELYARHREAVDAIKAVTIKAEVNEDVGEEA